MSAKLFWVTSEEKLKFPTFVFVVSYFRILFFFFFWLCVSQDLSFLTKDVSPVVEL